MSEDEILDRLEGAPLGTASLRRVAIEILRLHRGNEPLENSIIDGDISPEQREDFRSKIWSMIDTEINEAQDAKLRLCICAISESDQLDSNMAEMLWLWASRIGLNDSEISMTISEVLSNFSDDV